MHTPASIESPVENIRIASSLQTPREYRFGEFALELEPSLLRRHGEIVTIAPKSLAVLVYLVCHRDRLVSRTELLDRVWPDVIVGKGSLPQAVWEVRRVLGDERGAPRFIRTKYNHGYRFVGIVDARMSEIPRAPSLWSA